MPGPDTVSGDSVNTGTKLLAVVVNLAVWLLVVYLVTSPHHALTKARAAWHTMQICGACARWLGNWALRAELAYHREVELHGDVH